MKRLRPFLFALLALLVVIGLASGFVWLQFQPVTKTAEKPIRFVVAKGQGASTIATGLKEAGLIRQPLAFRLYAKLTGTESNLQAGSFLLKPSMTLREIVTTLTTGSEDVWVTVLEGWRAEEIAAHLQKQDLPQFVVKDFLTLAASAEGKLYPDTYLIPREFTAQQIFTLLTRTFKTKIEDALANDIAQSKRPFNQVLIMASLVEREAREYEQMKEVAGILWNRYDINMALQVDATLQYIQGFNQAEQSWWVPPSTVTKNSSSPFNTYKFPGLPPHPIANPGLDAIRASLKPNETNNFYYVHARDGSVYYAQTLEEHTANINRYLR